MFDLLQKFDTWSLIDITIIAIIIYNVLMILRGTRAMQMVTGLVLFFGTVFVITQLYPLKTLKSLVDKFYPSFLVIVVILFQDDIRRVLTGMGKKSLVAGGDGASSAAIIDEIIRASTALASQRIGALITVERNIILNRYIEIGVPVDGRVSKELLMAIFHPQSPIHDGSVIIQQGRIAAAGCFLPLTRDPDVDTNFGTRHRAAIGMTQESDAVVILVSEEAAAIGLVVDGKVSRGLSPQELRTSLTSLIGATLPQERANPVKVAFGPSVWFKSLNWNSKKEDV